MFYWCLLNLPTSVRYNLCNIKLIAVAKSEFLNSENVSLLLKNFIDDANRLSTEGIEMRMNNDELRTIFGIVIVGIGDTLALQELGGFVVGVGTAIKFCRTLN